MDEKLIELMRKCEEFYDVSDKKYSDSVWKEKFWEQVGEELTKSCSSHVFSAHFEVTIILLSPKF
jgi:hypothetical protein